MKVRKVIILSIVCIVVLTAGCTGYGSDSDLSPQVYIKTDRDRYTPIMSSTVGIGLTPDYPASVDNGTVAFRWQTDFGHFISWKAPDFKVNDIGPDITIGDEKVYWSYSPDDMDREKPAAHVTLTMLDKTSGKVINSTMIEIGWEDRHMARLNSTR